MSVQEIQTEMFRFIGQQKSRHDIQQICNNETNEHEQKGNTH